LVVVTGGALVALLVGPMSATATGPRARGASTRAHGTARGPTASISAVPAQSVPPAPLHNPVHVAVRVTNARVSRPVPPGFVGFSFEFRAVMEYAGTNNHSINPVLVQLIRNLAPGQAPVLRIGGNSTDNSWWPLPGVTQPPGVTYTLTKNWLAVTRGLAIDSGARLILGVNLKLDSPAEAAAEVHAYRAGVGTRYIQALEIGNEPELYKVFPWYFDDTGAVFGRPSTYDFTEYAQEVAMLAKRLPGFALAGPATGTMQWLSHLPQLFAAEPRLKVVTYHRYPLLACFSAPGDPRYPTIPNLLTLDSSRHLLDGVAPYIALAHKHGAAFRVDELNSVACKGQTGVSDTFASALWMLDSLFAMARSGIDGINIHTLPQAVYAPFAFHREHGKWVGTVSPEYYGVLLFTEAAPPGSRLLAVSQTSSADVRSRATVTPTGLMHVVLINDSLSSGHIVTVRPPKGVGSAVLERLRAPNAESTSGVTLAGQSFGTPTPTGKLAGKIKSVKVSLVHGRYLIRLPASSAAMLTFAPAAVKRPPGPHTA
jgi:hypothetical protein